MRIGLLTFHFSDNYGALLQAFCLQTYLQSLGHQVEFINYHPFYVEEGGSLSEILRPALSRKYLKKLYLFLNYKRQRLISAPGHASKLEAFREKHLSISPYRARSFNQLDRHLNYDHIIVGSDQIWNPSDQRGPDPVYYGHPFSCKIPVSSYAASFGSVSRIRPFAREILPWIRTLHHCSVREGEAQEFLLSYQVNSELVPDPTLLVDGLHSYKQYQPDIDFSSALFAYALRTQAGVCEVVSQLSTELGLNPISASSPWRRWKSIGKEIDLDPFTFLGAIAASKLVVSNSFHGVVCSVLLRKEFIAVSLPGSKAGLSSRIGSFLSAVGLEHRLLSPADSNQALDLAESQINWPLVEEKLILFRIQGRNFIDHVTRD
jgi:hypothetical protein